MIMVSLKVLKSTFRPASNISRFKAMTTRSGVESLKAAGLNRFRVGPNTYPKTMSQTVSGTPVYV